MTSALIDTNLMMLLVVGLTEPSYIAEHKRTKIFTKEDFGILIQSLDQYKRWWVTSHCLAEVSNLLKQTHPVMREELFFKFRAIGADLKESHISSSVIFASDDYLRLGIADTGFLQKSKRVSCSFTVDIDLYLAISQLGRKVINFNHLREASLLR